MVELMDGMLFNRRQDTLRFFENLFLFRPTFVLLCLFRVQVGRTFKDYMSYLVPMEIATTHVSVLTLLGSVYHTK